MRSSGCLRTGDQLLVVARGDGKAFVGAGDVAAELAAVGCFGNDGKAFDRQSGDAKGVAEMAATSSNSKTRCGVGRFVDAVDGFEARGFESAGDGFVGGEHELLDDAVSDVARAAGDAGHHAGFVEQDAEAQAGRSRWSRAGRVCG